MGFPRKNDTVRLLRVPRDDTHNGSYMLCFREPGDPNGEFASDRHDSWGCIGELMSKNDPERPVIGPWFNLSHVDVTCYRRVSWEQLPEVWQSVFGRYLRGLDLRRVSGLYRMVPKQPYTAEELDEAVIANL